MAVPTVAESVYPLLEAYGWPGNVWELCNVVERMVYLCEDGVITPDILPSTITKQAAVKRKSCDIHDYQAAAIEDALRRSNGNLSESARMLQIARSSLYRKLKQYNLSY